MVVAAGTSFRSFQADVSPSIPGPSSASSSGRQA